MSKRHAEDFQRLLDTYDSIDTCVEIHRLRYKTYWRNKNSFYWYYKLVQEVLELGFSLIGWHKDPIELELAQIAGICTNWLEYREESNE